MQTKQNHCKMLQFMYIVSILYMFGGIYEFRWRFESQKMSMMPHEVFSGLFIGCPLDSFVLKSNWLDIFDLTNKYKA